MASRKRKRAPEVSVEREEVHEGRVSIQPQPRTEEKSSEGDVIGDVRALDTTPFTKEPTLVVTLRSLPTDRDDLWRASVDSHFQRRMWNQNLQGLNRELPQNEVAAMALNEVAAEQGRGFFYYLPSCEVWKTPDKEPLLPRGRVPVSPGAAYPTLISSGMQALWHVFAVCRIELGGSNVTPSSRALPLARLSSLFSTLTTLRHRLHHVQGVTPYDLD